jgi:uncharacterized protein
MPGRQGKTGRRDGSFDAFELAARGGTLEGTVDVADLQRAADSLAPGDGRVAWRIAGSADPVGRPALEVALTGTVPLECRRCLESFAWPVAQRTLLLLARDEGELARLDEGDEHEVVLAAAALEAAALVEDELLLSLPFAPCCDRAACAGEAAAAPAPVASAFGALAALKRGPKPGR